MTPRPPAVSVVVPVYQGEATLATTLRSVLAQTVDDLEVVVLDNASTDATGAIARSFATVDPRVRVEVNAATVLMPENFNRAVRHARAPLVKVLCADDLLRPRCLEIQVSALAADPSLSFVVSREDLVDAQGRVLAGDRFLRTTTGMRWWQNAGPASLPGGCTPASSTRSPCGASSRSMSTPTSAGWASLR